MSPISPDAPLVIAPPNDKQSRQPSLGQTGLEGSSRRRQPEIGEHSSSSSLVSSRVGDSEEKPGQPGKHPGRQEDALPSGLTSDSRTLVTIQKWEDFGEGKPKNSHRHQDRVATYRQAEALVPVQSTPEILTPDANGKMIPVGGQRSLDVSI